MGAKQAFGRVASPENDLIYPDDLGMFTSIASKGQTAIKECKWPLCMNGTATGGGGKISLKIIHIAWPVNVSR